MNLPNSPNSDLIAFGHYSVKNDISGVTTWLERLVLRLHNDGFPVIVYLQHGGSDVKESSFLHSLREARIPVEIEPRLLYTEDDVRGVLNFLNRHQPQVFFPHCLEAMHYAAAMVGQIGLPWVMTIHSDDPVYWAITETLRSETNSGLMIGVSDYICQIAKEKALVNYPKTIPYGVPIPQKIASFSDAPFRIVFSGRVVEEQKRISLVLAAMAHACRIDPRIECWILGDGNKLESSKQWVIEQGLGSRICFLGRLKPSVVQSKLLQCQAILMMSDYEGLPVALLEAMAVGVVPVVRAIASGIPELVIDGETGILVDETPEKAARAIANLADRADLWHKCSIAARRRVTNYYSEDVCYQHWVKVISELCTRSSVEYPIKIPRRITLPPLHPDLVSREHRKPSVVEGVTRRLKRLKAKVISNYR